MKRMKEEASVVLLLLTLSLVVCCCYAQTKECTNIPTQSHSFRYELLTSKNETWKKEVMTHFHLTPTDDSAWADLLPRRFLSQRDQHDWAFMYRKIKNLGVFKDSPEAAGFLKEVPLQDVRLPLDSIHGRAQNTNLEYLLMLDVDRLLWSFRKTAGLDTPGTPYGGWEGSNVELRGHFVGHYLSASALMWASTQNDKLKDKMSAVVAGLSACQQKIGTGYLSAFPSEFFDRFEAIQPVWAPYYTIHKILAGLLDQHTFAGNPQALKVVTWMVDYFYNRVLNVITKNTISRHYESLNEETGGMNDVLYRLYTLTADPKHLMLAHLFDKPCFLGLLAVQANDITNFHANTHIPVVIGAQMRHEVTGDPLYKDIGTFFMDIINSSHSYATGGTSVSEFWHNPKRIADNLKTTETEESCTTYNMLKVSRHLFRWTKEVSYADYYERALTNGVLSIQRGTDPGVMIYMLPLARGVSKAKTGHGWGTQFDSFWCCYGTGIESFSKLGDSIYFEEQANEPTLYIIQYISSSFNWKSGEIGINQTVDPVVSWDPYLRVTFTFSPNEKTGSTLKFRIPSWTSLDGAKATLNDATLSLPSPGNFLSVSRQWSAGDKLKLQLPITIRTEAIKDDRPEYASVQAILYGPYLLAGHTTGDWDIDSGGKTSSGDWITPVSASYNSQLFTLYQGFANSTYALTNTNQSSLTMESLPTSTPDPDSAIDKTFRLVPKDPSTKFSTWKDLIGKSVTIELFNPPGMYVIHQGPNQPLIIDQSKSAASSSFIVVQGLDGQKETVSLKSESDDGCFVTTDGGVKLSCSGSGDDFNQAASFVIEEGIRKYNPISFVAKGANRHFLLEPLFTFKDLPYTVYFNIQS